MYLCGKNEDVTAQLICTFVFAYAKSRFSHDATHIYRGIMLSGQ